MLDHGRVGVVPHHGQQAAFGLGEAVRQGVGLLGRLGGRVAVHLDRRLDPDLLRRGQRATRQRHRGARGRVVISHLHVHRRRAGILRRRERGPDVSRGLDVGGAPEEQARVVHHLARDRRRAPRKPVESGPGHLGDLAFEAPFAVGAGVAHEAVDRGQLKQFRWFGGCLCRHGMSPGCGLSGLVRVAVGFGAAMEWRRLTRAQ